MNKIVNSGRMENLLFLGMLMPFIYTNPKTLSQISSGLGSLEFIRGLGSFILATIYVISTPRLDRATRHKSLPLLMYGLYVLVCLFSSLWSINPSATFLKAIQILGVFWCAKLLLSSQLTAVEMFRITQKMMMIISLLNFARYLVSPFVQFSLGEKVGFGSFIPLVASNLFGTFLGIYLLSLILISKYSFKVNLIIFLISFFLLYATHARIATAVSILSLLIAAMMAPAGKYIGIAGRNFLILISSFITLLIFAVSSGLAVGIQNYLNKYQNGSINFETLTGRTFVWRAARSYIMESPLVGHGFYSGHRIGLGTNYSQLSSYSNIDNMWLESMVDVGILGTLFLLLFLLLFFYTLSKNSLPRNFKIYSSLAMGNLLVMSFFNPSFQSACMSQVLALLLCVSVSKKYQGSSSTHLGGHKN
jgi:O-antigen ligase